MLASRRRGAINVVAASCLIAALWAADRGRGEVIPTLTPATIRSAETIMPGLPNTVTLAHFPPRAKIFLEVRAAPFTNGCFVSKYICGAVPLTRLPGSPTKTSGKGRAVIQFTIGTEYIRKRFSDNSGAQTFQLQNDDEVSIEARALRRRKGRLILGDEGEFVTVQIPAPPSS